MLDFKKCPVVDDHCHVNEPEKKTFEPIWLAREFFHGMAENPIEGVAKVKLWGAEEDLLFHFHHIGIVKTAICQMAKLFNCEPTLETVTAERNRLTEKLGFAGYGKLLYDDACIKCVVIDSPLPVNDPILDLTPGPKIRLLQMDPMVRKLIPESGSYAELLRTFQANVEKAMRKDFGGIKSHPAELIGLGFPPVEADEAERAFPAAKAGDAAAFNKVYMAVWMATMLQAQDLKFPMHIHTGVTGNPSWPAAQTDPFLLIPLLRQPRFLKTRLILLHGGYPWIQHASIMAHIFPHVWVDSADITPWTAQNVVENFRALLAMAPLSKLIVGSGGHGSPEPSWLSAKTAKIALTEILNDSVRQGLMCEKDADEAGRMILYDNAARLYGLES